MASHQKIRLAKQIKQLQIGGSMSDNYESIVIHLVNSHSNIAFSTPSTLFICPNRKKLRKAAIGVREGCLLGTLTATLLTNTVTDCHWCEFLNVVNDDFRNECETSIVVHIRRAKDQKDLFRFDVGSCTDQRTHRY